MQVSAKKKVNLKLIKKYNLKFIILFILFFVFTFFFTVLKINITDDVSNYKIKNINYIYSYCCTPKSYSSNYTNANYNNCKLLIKNRTLKGNELYLSQSNAGDIEHELTENVENQLKDIDFSELNNSVDLLSDTQKQMFGSSNFISVVRNFLYGKNLGFQSNFIGYFFSIIFDDILDLLPYFALIVAIAVIYSLVGQFTSSKGQSVANIVHISCFCAIALIVLKLVMGVMQNVSGVISNISSQMELIFPILLTLISAIGGTVTASTFQPVLATLSTIITKIFTTVLIPIFIFCVVFNVIGNISNNVKLEKFSKFCSSFFNWTIGIIFTIFIAFLAVNGLTVSNIDGISIKTAKYAIKSYIPILGSYLSDGVSLIITSSNLIKNAVGVTGLVLLISTVLSPIINIVLLMLLLKLVSAIIEPFCDQKISNFLYAISKTLNMLNTCLIAIGFMYLISVSILMTCSNIS